MKELHTGSLYWPTTLNSTADYPRITSNKKVKVAIVGGGMSGCICGFILAKSGIEAMMLERESVAGGSTSANAGLLQFSNDIMLYKLAEQIGEYDAVRFYRGCLDTVRQLGEVAAQLPRDVAFIPRSSLYFATSEQDLPMLRKEYEMLHKHGFDVTFLEADDISRQFPFRKPGALMAQGDAEVNPLQFVQGVSAAAAKAGLQIYEHTDIVKHEQTAEGRQLLRTSDGWEIEAEHVIFAIGYEPEELRGRLVKTAINRSFAAVTGVQDDAKLRANWTGQCLIWETARPYLYLRTTVDGRIVVGGLDEMTEAPIESEKLRHKRTDKLLEKITALFPMLDQPLEFEWSATFGESRDNLPFIGADPKMPGVYYSLGYGGNGTVYSTMAAYILRDMINGEEHPLASIVRLDRPSLLKV